MFYIERNFEVMNIKLVGMFLLRELARENRLMYFGVKMDFFIYLIISICFMCCDLWLFLGF